MPELGVELFERSRGSLTLTYAGQLFYDWALSTLHSREKLDARIGDIKDESSHLIRLGVSPHRSAILLPRIPSTIKISFSHRNTSSSPFRKHI